MPLTTQDDMLQDSGQAGAEIEITPAMIEAGVDVFSEWDSEFYTGPLLAPADLVAAIFCSMVSAVSVSHKMSA